MDGLQEMGIPMLGIVAAAAITFYAVSFSELREVPFCLPSFFPIFTHFFTSNYKPINGFLNWGIAKKSFKDLDELEDQKGGFQMTSSSRERRARRKAEKEAKR